MPLFALLLAFVGACLFIAFEQNNVISISNLSLLLGGFLVAVAGYTLAKPAEVDPGAQGFPRANAPGYVLMLASTAWFLWNIKTEDMEDYVNLKNYFYIGFGAVGVGRAFTCAIFLAVRGLAVFLLLLAKLILDTQRIYMFSEPVETMSEWRLIFAVWGYAIVIVSMWLIISPWRMRDIIDWMTAEPRRLVFKSGFRLLFDLLLIVLGLNGVQVIALGLRLRATLRLGLSLNIKKLLF